MTDTIPMSVDNAEPDGARAVAQILQRQGVEVIPVGSVQQIEDQLGTDPAAARNATVMAVDSYDFDVSMAQDLSNLGTDIVAVDPYKTVLRTIAPDVTTSYSDLTSSELDARCDWSTASTAGQIWFDVDNFYGSTYKAVSGATDVTTCFSESSDPDQGMVATTTIQDQRVTVVGTRDVFTNQGLDQAGNAGFALTVLGEHPKLFWLILHDDAIEDSTGLPLADVWPPWLGYTLWLSVAVAAALALWRGRRFGRLVTEKLPVVVKGSETVIGRGRLYRRSGAQGHAAAALRAATASRLASRLGLPKSTEPAALVDAIAEAALRDRGQVAALLYGPPPSDDVTLLALSHALSALEKEIRL